MLRDHQLSLVRKPRVQGEKAHGHDQEFWDWNLQSHWSNNPWLVGFEGKYAKLLLNILSQNPLKIKQASKHLGFISCTVYLSCLFMFHDRSRLPPGHYSSIPGRDAAAFPWTPGVCFFKCPTQPVATVACTSDKLPLTAAGWQHKPHPISMVSAINIIIIYNINMYIYILYIYNIYIYICISEHWLWLAENLEQMISNDISWSFVTFWGENRSFVPSFEATTCYDPSLAYSFHVAAIMSLHLGSFVPWFEETSPGSCGWSLCQARMKNLRGYHVTMLEAASYLFGRNLPEFINLGLTWSHRFKGRYAMPYAEKQICRMRRPGDPHR